MNPKRLVLLATLVGCLMLGGSVACGSRSFDGDADRQSEVARRVGPLAGHRPVGRAGPKAAEAVAPLSELLKDSSAKVRAHAVCALGEIGAAAKPAVPALAELVKDPDETVRRQVVKAVMKIRPGPESHRAAVRQAFGGFGPRRADAGPERDCRCRPQGRAGADLCPEQR